MKKYDCTRTLDFGHERNRLCKSYEECEGCLLSGGHCVDFIFTEEQIRNLQKWSDEHPEKPTITKDEQLFLECFRITEGKRIEKVNGHVVLFGGVSSELWPTMFPFIENGESWTIEELLKLEVRDA